MSSEATGENLLPLHATNAPRPRPQDGAGPHPHQEADKSARAPETKYGCSLIYEYNSVARMGAEGRSLHHARDNVITCLTAFGHAEGEQRAKRSLEVRNPVPGSLHGPRYEMEAGRIGGYNAIQYKTEKYGAKDTPGEEEGFATLSNNQVGAHRRHHEAVVMPNDRTGIGQKGRSQVPLDTMILGDADGAGPQVQRYGTMAGRGETIPHVPEHCQPRENLPFPGLDPCRLGKCDPVAIRCDQAAKDRELPDQHSGSPAKCTETESSTCSLPEDEGRGS